MKPITLSPEQVLEAALVLELHLAAGLTAPGMAPEYRRVINDLALQHDLHDLLEHLREAGNLNGKEPGNGTHG